MEPKNEKQAAKDLGLSVQTLRNWRHIQRGPSYCKIGRRVVYFASDLETYLASNRIKPERG